MMMILEVDSEFQYFSLLDQPFFITEVSNMQQCRMICLFQEQCRTANFHGSTNQCELFVDTPGSAGYMSDNVGSVAMLVIDGTRVSSS